MILTICFFITVGLVALDLGIKNYVDEEYELNQEKDSILEPIVIRKKYNKGFALNSLENRQDIVKKTSLAAVCYMLLYDLWLFIHPGKWFRKLGMSFATAGILSNSYDRLMRGKVVDYIGIKKPIKGRKITLNLADLCLSIGLAVMALGNIGKIFKIFTIFKIFKRK